MRSGYHNRNNISEPEKSNLQAFLKWQPKKDYLIFQHMRESTVHGLKYIAQPNRSIIERIFWTITILASSSVAIYMIYGIIEKYDQAPMIVSFQPKQTSIAQVPYPAVSICNVNRIRRKGFDDLMKTVLESEKYSPNEVNISKLVLRQLDHVCRAGATFSTEFEYSLNETTVNLCERGFGFDCEPAVNHTPYTRGVNSHASFSPEIRARLGQSILSRCDEMILLCLWEGEVQNCSDIFQPIATDMGFCCTFNMIPLSVLINQTENMGRQKFSKEENDAWKSFNIDEDLAEADSDKPKMPFLKRQSKAGQTSGLSFLVNPENDDYFCGNNDGYGFRIFAHSPLDFPHVADFGVAISPELEVFINMYAEITVADKGIKYLSQKKRHCKYSTENTLKSYNFYTFPNCVDECIANTIANDCGCVRFDMPQSQMDNATFCEGVSYHCSKDVKKRFDKEGTLKNCKHCLPSCNRIEYRAQSSSLPLTSNVWTGKGNEDTYPSWFNKNVTIVHVFFGSDNVYSRVRKMLYSFNDVFAHSGAILGLLLGVSVISFVEPINYFFAKFRNHQMKQRSKSEMTNTEIIQVKENPNNTILQLNHMEFENPYYNKMQSKYNGAYPNKISFSH